MNANPFHRAIYLTGPTASGKTAVGVALAERLDAEVIALDSMTLYRGMDIGTAKPTVEERRGIPHYLIDLLDPWEASSVARYREWARQAVLDIEKRGKSALFVGGTPMYLKTLLRGLFEGPEADPEFRQELEAVVDHFGPQALHQRLAEVDPETAQRLHSNDSRRIIRALEVLQSTGRPISVWQREHNQPAPTNVPVLALERPRNTLRDRINRRVEQMFLDGFVLEVDRLIKAPQGFHPIPAQGVGYREVTDFLGGRIASEHETIALIQTKTRQFAKRQGTWFRGLEEVQSLPIAASELPAETADRAAQVIDQISREG